MVAKHSIPWILLIVAACGVFQDDDDDETYGRPHGGKRSAIVDVSVEEAFDLVTTRANDPGFVILDVRTPLEFADGHLENAVNLDYLAPEFEALLAGIDPSLSILVHCLSGGRSAGAVELMEALGFVEVFHMKDGYSGWLAAGYPVVTD